MPSEDLISKLGFKEETTTLQNEHFDIQMVEIGPGVVAGQHSKGRRFFLIPFVLNAPQQSQPPERFNQTLYQQVQVI